VHPVARADVVKRLLAHLGGTYAVDAGSKLADKPSPLYQLPVRLGLPTSPRRLALVDQPTLPRLVAGCVRAALVDSIVVQVRG
jgi:hypothetical protein